MELMGFDGFYGEIIVDLGANVRQIVVYDWWFMVKKMWGLWWESNYRNLMGIGGDLMVAYGDFLMMHTWKFGGSKYFIDGFNGGFMGILLDFFTNLGI